MKTYHFKETLKNIKVSFPDCNIAKFSSHTDVLMFIMKLNTFSSTLTFQTVSSTFPRCAGVAIDVTRTRAHRPLEVGMRERAIIGRDLSD